MSGDAVLPPRITAVICTWDRTECLRNSLASLVCQRLPLDDYEVLVVDNNPSPSKAVEGIVQDVQSAARPGYADRWRYRHCPVAGLSHARNAGISEARGEICCFIDDDAIAASDWLEQIENAFDAHPDAAVIGGHITLQVPEPRPAILRPGLEVYWSQFITPYATYTEVDDWDSFPWGANWSARKQALVRINGFRTGYGRTGNDYWGGEELVAAAQLLALGYKIGIAPQAKVLHIVSPSRFQHKHLWRTMLGSALVSYQAQRDLYTPRRARRRSYMSILRNHSRPPRGCSRWGNYWDVALLRLAAHTILTLRRLSDALSDWLQVTRIVSRRTP